MTTGRSPQALIDLVVGGLLIGLAIVIWVGSRGIAAPFFDPLGSAALPRACALLIAALSAAMIGQALRELHRPPAPTGVTSVDSPAPAAPAASMDADDSVVPADTADAGDRATPDTATWRRRPWLALGLVGLCAGYAAAMQWNFAGFRTATGGFTFAAIVLLGGSKPRTLLFAALVAAVLAIGGQFVFSRWFYIDLPQ